MFEVDNLRSDDRLQVGRAEAFLLENPDPGVRMRPEDQIRLAIDTGLGLQVTRDGAVCGLSLVYKYEVLPSGPIYSEIGTMRIIANGFGLQTFLAKFHLVQLTLEEFYGGPGTTFAVVTPGSPSDHNLRVNVGMHLWEPPADLGVLRQAEGVPFSREKAVLTADVTVIRGAFDSLREWNMEGNLFSSPKQDERIHVCSRWFRPDVLDHGP